MTATPRTRAAASQPDEPNPILDLILPPGAGPTLAAVAALDGAVAAAFPSFGSLAKDAENTYHNKSYLSLEGLLDAVREPLMAQQVLIASSIQLVGPGFVVITTIAHSGGGWRSSSFPVGDPLNPQKVAAAATYGLRINLQQLLALTATDDDGNSLAATAPASYGQAPEAWSPQQPAVGYNPPPAAYAPAPTPQPAPSHYV
jgi:hypothetical protein